MIRLQDLSILEKANQLEALMEKADSEVDYSIQVKWGSNKEIIERDARIVIANTRLLFQSDSLDYPDRLEQLDISVREEAYAHYHSMLDSYLKKFPEYELNDVITESV